MQKAIKRIVKDICYPIVENSISLELDKAQRLTPFQVVDTLGIGKKKLLDSVGALLNDGFIQLAGLIPSMKRSLHRVYVLASRRFTEEIMKRFGPDLDSAESLF